jgi:alcohol dehydrogenase class IV
MKNFKLNESDILSNQDWTFPTDTIYGPGRFKEIGQLCKNNDIKNPLIVSDSGSKNLSFIKNLEKLLSKKEIKFSFFF